MVSKFIFIEKIAKAAQSHSKTSINQKMLKISLEKIFKTIYNRVILIKKEPHSPKVKPLHM